MKIKEFLITKTFPGTVEEYHRSKEIHIAEIKRYRTRKQYILGALLFFGPLFYLLVISHSWLVRVLLLAMMCGEILIRDTITEHYCLKIHREGGSRSGETNKRLPPPKRLHLVRFLMLFAVFGVFLGVLSALLRSLFHFLDTPAGIGVINGGGIVIGLFVFQYLADAGKMNWFFKNRK
jgi:polyferredoxin